MRVQYMPFNSLCEIPGQYIRRDSRPRKNTLSILFARFKEVISKNGAGFKWRSFQFSLRDSVSSNLQRFRTVHRICFQFSLRDSGIIVGNGLIQSTPFNSLCEILKKKICWIRRKELIFQFSLRDS